MADEGRRIPYIIELGVKDESLRKQMSKWNWEEITGIKDLGKRFEKPAREASDAIESAFANTNIDWNKALQTDAFKKAVTQVVQHANAELREGLLGKEDAKNVTEFIEEIGKAWKEIGVTMYSKGFARSMAAFAKSVEPLVGQIDKLVAVFDRLFNKINEKSSVVAPSFKFANVSKEIDDIQRKIDKLNDTTSNINIKISSTSNTKEVFGEVERIIEQITTAKEKIEGLQWDIDDPDIGVEDEKKALIEQAKELEKLGDLYKQLDKIKQVKPQRMVEAMAGLGERIDPKKELDNTITKLNSIKTILSETTGSVSDGGAQQIGIEIALPTTEDVRHRLNSIIDQLNKPNSLHKVKLEVDDSVVPIEGRLDKATSAIEDKLMGDNGILEKTKKWREQMLQQFKFDKEVFSFKFDDKLIEQLTDMFEDYQLKLSVDAEFLSDQIKTVLENSSISLGGGTANINSNEIIKAVVDGIRIALFGGEIPALASFDTNEGTVAHHTNQIAGDIVDAAKHLDIAEEYVQDVVKKIKKVAEYATRHIGTDKDSNGTVATRNRFKSLGIDLEAVNNAKTDNAVAKILEEALLPTDEFGDIKGVAIIDELSHFKDSSSKTISAFLESVDEVFYNLRINTSTVEKWVKKRQGKKVFDAANEKAKAARSLQTVRSAIYQGETPDVEQIDQITETMSSYWAQLAKRRLSYKEKDIEALALDKRTKDTSLDFDKSLELARQEIYENILADIKAPFTKLREARVALGDATDDKSVEEFRVAAQEFYKGTKALFTNLKKQAEDTFKGTVFVRGKNGVVPKHIEEYKDFARVKDGEVIVDVEVNSTLNDVALGVVNGKYSGRPSDSAEKQMMRGQHSDLTTPKRYEKAILEKAIEYSGFKPKGVENAYDLDRTLSINKSKKALLESTIQSMEEDKNAIGQESLVLEQTIKELSEKNKKISNARKKEAAERINVYQEELSRLSVDQSLEEQRIKELEGKIRTQNYYKKYAEDRLAELPEDASDDLKKPYIERINKIDGILAGLTEDLTLASNRKKEIDANIKKAERGLTRTKNSVAILIPQQLSSAISQRDELIQRTDDIESSITESKQRISELDAFDARINAQKEYNELKERSLILEGEIQKLEADGSATDVIAEKKEEAKTVAVLIEQATDKLRSAGGEIGGQTKQKEYSAEDRKIYALREISQIDKDLITAKAQVQVSKSRLRQVDKKIKELDEHKLGAGYGAVELAKIKYSKEQEFKSSAEYKSFEKDLLEKIKNEKNKAEDLINQSKNTHRDTFNEKVENAMIRDGLNPYDKKATKDFLETQRGQQLAAQYEKWVEEDTKRILDQYNINVEEFRKNAKELQQQALEAYRARLVDGDLLDYEVIRESLKKGLEEEKEYRKNEYDPDKYQAIVDQLEADRKAAIAYGSVGDDEILSPDVIEDLINKKIKLKELEEDREKILKEIETLEKAGVQDSDDSVKKANAEKERLDAEIEKYERFVRDRQKIVDKKYKDVYGSENTEETVKTAKSEVASTKTSETYVGLIGAIKDALGNTDVNLTPVTEILQQIFEILNKFSTDGIKTHGEKNTPEEKQKPTKKTEAELIRDNALKQDDVVRGLAAGKGSLYNQYVKDVEDLNNAVKEANEASDEDKKKAIKKVKTKAQKVSALSYNILKNTAQWDYLVANSDSGAKQLYLKNGESLKDKMEMTAKKEHGVIGKHGGQLTNPKYKYDFLGFDGDTLTYQLTDIEGKIRKVTMTWNEFTKQVVTTSDKSVYKLSELAGKVESFDEKFKNAINMGYLSDSDEAYKGFLDKVEKIKKATTLKDADLARNDALYAADQVSKQITKNKKLYTGTTEMNAVLKQHGNLEASGILNKTDLAIINEYNAKYEELTKLHSDLKSGADKRGLLDEGAQKELLQASIATKQLGKDLEKAYKQAETLKQLREDSGTYKTKDGQIHNIGKEFQLDGTVDKYTAMRKALEELGATNIKVDMIHQKATGTIRHNDRVVSDLEVAYDGLHESLSRYHKTERESLTGIPAFLNGFQKKFNSIMQYLSMTMSIHRVLSELRRGVQYVREIDKALTELKKVTSETEETYDKFLKTAAKTAEKVGSTIQNVVSSTADWARLGYAMSDAAKFAETTQILMNVSEFTDVSQATDTLISAVQAFGYTADTSMDVVDLLNTIGK